MRYVDGIPKPVIWCDIDDVVFHLLPNLIKYYNLKYWTNKALKDVWDLRYESVNICDIVEKHKLYKNMMPTRILHFLKQKVFQMMKLSPEYSLLLDTKIAWAPTMIKKLKKIKFYSTR